MSLAVSDECRKGGLVDGVCTEFADEQNGKIDHAEFFEESSFPHRD